VQLFLPPKSDAKDQDGMKQNGDKHAELEPVRGHLNMLNTVV
jgi:hypothetical protein